MQVPQRLVSYTLCILLLLLNYCYYCLIIADKAPSSPTKKSVSQKVATISPTEPQPLSKPTPTATVPIQSTPPPIVPPKEVQSVIEKLVQFVAKNGPNFEQKVKEKEGKNEKFGFLYPWSPHHTYYKYCLNKVHYLKIPSLLS